MNDPSTLHVYGPVPSRRLGRSLGLDLVPLKTCNYNCVYCQLGRTPRKVTKRREYVPVRKILQELEARLQAEGLPDYITIAGSGEPTLNTGIGEVIRQVKAMTQIPVAVLTNGSFLWMTVVQDDLMAADLVLPSLDAGCERLFRRINRPHRDIRFETVVGGLVSFTSRFPGEVWLEVFLLADLTASESEVQRIADLTERISPARVQLNTVARPAAEQFALPVPWARLLELKSLFPGHVEVISEPATETREQIGSGAHRLETVLALLERRPCTAKDVARGLGIHVTEAIKGLTALLIGGKVRRSIVENHVFYSSILHESPSRR